jgi:galactokinase
VPLGAGLSSSASLEVATAGALLAMASRTFEPVQLALLCQRAENDYVGMRCGIMDQYTAVMGRENFALELDCQRLTHRLIPISFEQAHPGERARLVLCDSLRKHELAASEYNRRRLECESALAALQPRLPTVRSLSGLSIAQLNAHATLLNDVQLRRARHVISENERVRLAAEALLAGELVQAGQLMYASHESLRDDYEVSCLELDCLVTAARESPGTYGARMTGGGFGGCTVNLVREDSIDRFERHVNLRYRETFGLEPRIYHCRSADGLRLEHAA